MRILIAFGSAVAMRDWLSGQSWVSTIHTKVVKHGADVEFHHEDGSYVRCTVVQSEDNFDRLVGMKFDLVTNDASMRAAYIQGLSERYWSEFVRSRVLVR